MYFVQLRIALMFHLHGAREIYCLPWSLRHCGSAINDFPKSDTDLNLDKTLLVASESLFKCTPCIAAHPSYAYFRGTEFFAHDLMLQITPINGHNPTTAAGWFAHINKRIG
ncbi:hypothetical protein AVEN_9228-1 [Araneus ventricosus]|uniref:Uncharacterized protein n=1 Tax=Araneus ventricosus TaxID=182803 RepID=A0A4Y2QIU2_ARAVE|nr:hypothetical protein AVEN_9228-1 [Araneus ventricosus]